MFCTALCIYSHLSGKYAEVALSCVKMLVPRQNDTLLYIHKVICDGTCIRTSLVPYICFCTHSDCTLNLKFFYIMSRKHLSNVFVTLNHWNF